MKPENRKPNSERKAKSEGRIAMSRQVAMTQLHQSFEPPRTSDFFRASGFGFRNSPVNRRQFLASAGFATAALFLNSNLPAGADDLRASDVASKPRLSTSSIHFMKLPIEQACERIAALGFEAIDIWSAHDNCPHLDDIAARLGPEGLKELLAKTKLKLYAFSVYRGGYARYAELLGKAGGGVAVQGSAPPCKPEELTAKMRAYLDGIKPLAELAEKHNSWLAIENHGHALLDSMDSFKAFVEMNRYPRVGIAVAPYHLQALGANVEEAIQICGDQLLFFYAWQQQPGIKQLPGHGPADFKPWLNALAKARYKWYVNPFMHGHLDPDAMSAALAKSRDYLKAL